MGKIIIAVGSTRRPKLDAVASALAEFGDAIGGGAEFEILGFDVPSGVRHTPLSREDMMAGARHRAEALIGLARERRESWKFFVGLEGGLDVISESGRRCVFLESWAYVSDGGANGAFGRAGGILLPEPLVRRVVDEGVELSEAIDAFVGGRGIRDAQGAWGVLTRNRITRQGAFRIALIKAFAPLFNSALYAPGDAAS
ncbi:MAG: DUF84 family protein [Candidatus Acidiferrales bacterium]